ncbi:MAG: hypothetical protein AB8G99_14730 [Planctomycetaceae bacterium]
MTEWSIRAKNREKAIETAWVAVRSAKIKRDRRYALALLVESYRLKEKKKGLEALIKEFEKLDKDEKQSLTDEMRTVWISLLRELERYEDAIRLFKEGAKGGSGFTVEMRRELLEMEGEAGRTDAMMASYRELISAEPDQLVWRNGLTKILLQQGKEAEAKQLWTDYIAATENGQQLLLSAQSLGDLGLDGLAAQVVQRMVKLNADQGQGLLFLADLQQRRGRLEESEETLNQLNNLAGAGDVVRFELAAAFERVGRQDKAVEVIEGIRNNRTEVATDLEMRLAWLYSETGEEDKALEQWLSLWKETKSIPRRRYVEDRLMTVASRLGTLGDIAVDLEVKLMDGKADDREAGLLTRIYSRVNDSVAASEVLEEYMTQAGKQEVERLQEKARIYQICNDYWSYEKVIEQLIEVDPPGETDYLRQLALSMLERGKAQDARKVLMKLRDAQGATDDIGGEFEAGVLSLVGMKKEAADAYRKGIASHPDRIESYLLLANLLKDLGQTQRAVGMFQYLAENADKDDLFTIAIDGLLNMEANRNVMQWARRITLQRLADRDDKNYLYQLLADLSEEVNDKNGRIRAMENSLAVSGSRRLQILRECMDLSSRIRGGVFYSNRSRGPTNANNEPFFAFGRRLIGLGELMPPQVFLDLGQAFLDDGDVGSAERTFSMARNHADERGYERDVAKIFETAGRRKESLERYDRLLRTNPSDVALIARVAKLNEQIGQDDIASKFYTRGFNLLLDQTPLTTLEKEDESQTGFYWAQNQDAYDKYAEQLLRGVLVTMPDSDVDGFLDEQLGVVERELNAITNNADSGRFAKKLSDSPRIQRRSAGLRRMLFSFDRPERLRQMDSLLLSRLSDDKSLPGDLVRARIERGELAAARTLLKEVADEKIRTQFAAELGDVSAASATGKLSPKEMWRQLMPHWLAGDKTAALKILRRVDRTKLTGSDVGQTISYVYTGAQPEYKQQWSSDVFILCQLAMTLGDEGLALQFARSRLQRAGSVSGPIFGDPAITLLKAFKQLLPQESFTQLARFAFDSFKESDRNGLAYLWLLSQLEDEKLSDDDMLARLDELKISLDYYRFTFKQAVEIFPKPILATALTRVMDNTDQKMVAGPLAAVPFEYEKPLSTELQKVIVDGVKEGLPASIREDYLTYVATRLPGRYYPTNQEPPAILQNLANAECALKVIAEFAADEVRASSEPVANRATALEILILKELGRTEEAVDKALKLYDPKRTITDYYERYTWQRVEREVFPLAPDRFMAKSLGAKEAEKPTVADTDKRIAFMRSLNDEAALRAEYERAWKLHPKQTKYPRAYKSWEQRAGRTMNVLAIDERLLTEARFKQETPKDAADAKRKAKSQQARLLSMHRRVGDQWFAVGHPVNGLQHWRLQDDIEIARFEEQKQKRALAKANPKGQSKSAPKEKTKSAGEPPKVKGSAPLKISAPALKLQGSIPAAIISRAATAVKQVAKATAPVAATVSAAKPSTKPKTVADLKKAVEAKKPDEAAAILRGLWRTYPPVEATPYRIFSSPARFGNLRWPGATSKPTVKQDDKKLSDEEKKKLAEENKRKADEAKREAEKRKRQRLRGGLAILDLPPTKRTVRPPAETVWSKLATEPWAIEEMDRLIRSRSTTELSQVRPIILALLKSRREAEGDKAVFKSLLDSIRNGRAGRIQSIQIIAMLEENHELLGDNAEAVIDDLSQSLDLDQASVSLQLAKLCVKSGLKERGSALFVHYASRASDRDYYGTDLNISFTTLIEEAREVFEGEELFQLVEEMFLASPVKSDATVDTVLELRHKQLEPAEAARRSESYFAALDENPTAIRISPSVWGTRIFSEAKDFRRAQQCLRSAIRRNTMPQDEIGVRVFERKLNRKDMLDMFPANPERHTDYAGWLKVASATIHELIAEGASRPLATEMLLVIAHRQCQLQQQAAARLTLQPVADNVAKDKRLLLLAIDVFRESGLVKEALELQTHQYDAGTLSYVRFGDLLTDVASIQGKSAAAELFAELSDRCLDEDLLNAAGGIADAATLNQIRQAAVDAKAEFEARKKAASSRRSKRAKWSREDAEQRKAEAKKKAEAKQAKKTKGSAATKPKPVKP